MKTFTTYAEKKAKQFLNLLQGYTKGIRFTAILILLLMGVSNAWAYVTYYLKSSNTTWSTDTYDWGFTHGTTTTTYMDNNGEFKLWRTDWGQDGWFGQGNNTTINLKENDHNGVQLQQWKDGGNVKYVGPSGMVCFHMDQNDGKEDKPWVWITRPTFYLKHNWGGGSWTWKGLKDNEDGTYTLTAKYGGTGVNYGDDNTSQDGWGYIEDKTPDGNPTTSHNCEFKFNSKDKSLTITRLYTITYNGNGHTGGTVPEAVDKKHGTSITLSSSTPTRTGYTFAGWNTKQNGTGTTYAKGATYSTNADVTLYAKWTANTYTITYKDQNNANFSGSHATGYPTQHTYGTATTLSKATKTGYTFGGWFDNKECTGTAIESLGATAYTANITLYAQWTPNTYTVTLDRQYGEGGDGSVTATFGSPMPKINVPTRAGYTFGGYWTEAEGKGIQYYEADGTSAKEWDKTTAITLHAQWTPITYYVAFDANGGTGDMEKQTFTYNQSQNLSSNTFEKAGYHFLRWNTKPDGSGIGYADKNSVNNLSSTHQETITLYAQWEANTYRVIFNNNGGQGEMAAQNFTYGVEQVLIKNTFKKSGYFFAGWNTAADGSGTPYNDNTRVNNLTTAEEITLYAQWTAVTITATLTPTEGTIGANNLTFSITSNVPTNSGYQVGVYNFGEDDYAGGELSGVTSYNNNPQTHTGRTPSFVKAGTYYTRAFIMLNSETLAKSDKIAFVVRDGGTTPDPEELTWKMYDKTTEKGIFTKQDENTYTLTIDVPENCNWLINYKYDQQYYTGAESLLQERTLVVGSGQVSWQDGAGTFTITIRKDSETWKISAIKQSPITVTATEGGSVNSSGIVQVGNRTPTTFTATPAPGYRFDHWTYSGGVVRVTENNTDEQGSITIIATGTGTLTANFVRVHTVNFFATPAVAGTATATVNSNAITSGEKLDDNTSVTFTAAVANAYNGQCTFVRWVDGAGNPLSSNATYNHTVKEDITVKAIFKIKQYTLTFSASDGGYVSATANNSAIASPANLDYNTSVTLTAEPDAGCAFEGWYEGGTWKSSSTSYDVTLTANKTIEARFTKGTTVYMKAIEYWKKDHPRYAIYYWGAGDKEGWHDMTNVDCNGDIYEGYVPAGYTNFKFVRLAPSTSNEWENKWNETPDLTTTDHAGEMYIQPHVYLKPNSNWTQSNARFAAYFYADGKEAKWFSMNDLDGDGIYSCEIPTGYTSVIFCRMNPAHTDNRWNTGEDTEETKRFWNQTNDLTVPADNDSNNLYTVKDGAWDNGDGSWSAGPHKNGWQPYAEPSYKITYSNPTNGTITVTTKAGAAIKRGDELTMGDEIKITFTPADGYELINYNVEYATETGEEGVYSVCGPTNITAEFAKAGTARTVYLRPNEDWLRDEPIFAAYAWNNSSKANKWYTMTTKADDYTGAYSCNISSTYDWVTFVRIKPAGRDGSDGSMKFENAWNQTKDLAIIDKYNDKTNDHKLRFAIGDKVGGEGEDKEKYDGAWEENTPIWGLTANFNDWTAEKAVFKGYPGHLDEMPSFGTSHAFKLYNFFYESNQYFGNAGTMKRANSGQWWTMVATDQANCQMILDVKGDYIYQMRFLTVGAELRKQISVTYPEANMYYLMYEEETDEGSKQRISYGIRLTGEERLDTVSFFVDVTKSAKIYILDGNQNKVGGPYTIIGTGGQNPGGAMAPQRRTEDNPELSIEKGCGITESGVYNFVAQQDANKKVTLLINNWHAYTGAYYIRTDAASGGWGGYKQNGNKMTYTSYADKNHNFDHYYCKWITSSESSYSNVKFCVANDYSHKLSDEWDGDEIIEKVDVPTGCLPEDANVRFGWDSKTNELSRAYISGSAKAVDRFLVLTGNEYLLDIEGKAFPNGTGNREGLKANEEIFDDMGNWLYQLDVKANTQTAIKLTAQFNNRVQTFFGDARAAADGEELIDATTPEYHKVRMIYNFKTNHLLVAWLLDPQQPVNNENVASDVLIIRENHGDANQLQFKQGLNQMAVKTAYATITFTKDHVTDTEKSQWQRYEYWVSFPFDVKISDVFGFGEYGTEWIMQLYDGASRAKNGLWVDSPTYWKYITNRNYTLKAGVGYVLKLQASKMTDETAFKYSDKVSLYFPSTPNAEGNTIISATPDTQHKIDEHKCTIERDNRNIYDSHWNLIGVPGYANISEFNTAASLSPVEYKNGEVSFYYAYNAANNTYQATTATSNFKNMHSYMVQFAGTINWSTKEAIKPVELAARRNSDTELEKAIFRLELAQGEKMADQTFVQLQQEGATPEFDMNLDLTKIINSGANIYTLVGNSRIQTAGNALPMDEAMVVPVGVKIDAEGEYTFRMPDGTEGMVVELVDYETYNRTNLLLTDYTVTLPKGTSENRFALHIQPQKDVVTSLENIGEGVNNGEAVNKYLIDGKLIIRTADGVVYDAQGKRL